MLNKFIKRKEGTIILDISADTPAAQYGLKRGDLIYSIDDKSYKDRTTFTKCNSIF